MVSESRTKCGCSQDWLPHKHWQEQGLYGRTFSLTVSPVATSIPNSSMYLTVGTANTLWVFTYIFFSTAR